MKLNSKHIHPENNTMWFAINNLTKGGFLNYKHSSGFVGLVLFLDGKWYSMPDKLEVPEENNFLWINFIQPERSKREDSQKCEMRCSEHCGNTVRKVQ